MMNKINDFKTEVVVGDFYKFDKDTDQHVTLSQRI